MSIEQAIEAQESKPVKIPDVFISDFIDIQIQEDGRVESIFVTIGIKGDLSKTALNRLPVINIKDTESWFIAEDDLRPCEAIAFALKESRCKRVFVIFDFTAVYQPHKDGFDYFFHAFRNKKAAHELYASVAADKRFFIKLPKLEKAQKFTDFLDLTNELGEDFMEAELKLVKDSKYFDHIHIDKCETAELTDKLEITFGCKDVETCYAHFAESIGNKEFVYRNIIYKKGRVEVKRIAHQHASRFIKVGDKYIYVVRKTIKEGTVRLNSYRKHEKGDIVQTYGKDFIKEIPIYDDLVIYPQRFDEYDRKVRRTINGQTYNYYNLYEPLPISPKPEATPDNFPTILDYLHHLSQGEATLDNPIRGDKFTLLMDWLRVAYRYPRERLPMLIFSTKERGTGKSTFLHLMQYIFGENSIVTNMTDLMSKFNSHNAYKTMVLLEEVKMEGDKHVNNDMLKDLITGNTISIEPKGLSKYQIANYNRYVAVSNHEEKILPVDEATEDRFLVMKPASLGSKRDGGEAFERMKKEMPYFLRYLLDSPLCHGKKLASGEYSREDRLWFKGKDVRTEEFFKINEYSKSFLEKDLNEYMKELFMTFLIPEFKSHPRIVHKLMKEHSSYRYTVGQIRKFLREKLGPMQSATPLRHPKSLYQNEDGIYKIEYYTEYNKKTNEESLPIDRRWNFRVEDWLSDEEMQQFLEEQKRGFKSSPAEDLPKLTEENMQQLFNAYMKSIAIDGNWHSVKETISIFNSRVEGELELNRFIECIYDWDSLNPNKVKVVVDAKDIMSLKDFSKWKLAPPF